MNTTIKTNRLGFYNKVIEVNSYNINQTQLIDRLNLPLSVISYLKYVGVLKFRKIGRELLFDVNSIQKFEESFIRDDYLTVSETKKLLVERGFYNQFNPLMRLVINKFHFSVTVKNLISMDKLHCIRFGKTVYISKNSLQKTIHWLKKEEKKLNFFPSTDDLQSNKKKSKKMKSKFKKSLKFKTH